MHALLSAHNVPSVSFLYHAMALTGDIMVRFNETNPAHYRLFNIRTVVAEAHTGLPPFLTPLAQHGRFRLLAAPESGYFELVSVPYRVQTDKQRFYDRVDPWLASDWVAKRQHLRLDFEADAPTDLPQLPLVSPLPPIGPATDLGRVDQEQRDGERYQATVHVTRDSFLLFKMTYHPNWHITVNDKLHETVMLSPGFIGIRLPPGDYNVTVHYQAESWKIPLLWAGMCLCLLVARAERRGAVAWLEEQTPLALGHAMKHGRLRIRLRPSAH